MADRDLGCVRESLVIDGAAPEIDHYVALHALADGAVPAVMKPAVGL